MAKTEEVPMVRMVNVTTGQPVTVRAEKVARMTADWRVDDGEKADDPRESAKAGASKADKDRAAARAKAESDAAKAAEQAADGANAAAAGTTTPS